MGIIALQTPVVDAQLATEAPKIASDFTTLQTVINGGLDTNNLSAAAGITAAQLAAALAQAAAVNQAGQTVKGVSVNAGSGTRTNVAYGALNDAADQVTGIVLPSNGLIAVWFQATWQQNGTGNIARAGLFLGSTQVVMVEDMNPSVGTPVPVQAIMPNPMNANQNAPLFSNAGGLATTANAAAGSPYSGDVATGQLVGGVNNAGSPAGGPCYIFAAAGTYTVSVKFLSGSGSVTASSRKLWVEAKSFA